MKEKREGGGRRRVTRKYRWSEDGKEWHEEGRVCRSITDIRLGHERNKPICIICPAGINSPLKVATNEVIHWMNVGVEGERERERERGTVGKRKEGKGEKVKRPRGRAGGREREREKRCWRGGVKTNPNPI